MVLHLCEEHARVFLSQETDGNEKPSALSGLLASQLKLKKSAEQLAEADSQTCPVCGITFAEFRQSGRLGCAYDYICFEQELMPLLVNIHGAKNHQGKRPTKKAGSPDRQHKLIQLRREMQEAVGREDYERAGQLRDEIKTMEESDNLPKHI